MAGTVVEVHGLFDAANDSDIATRVEAEDNAAFYKLRGLIGNSTPRPRPSRSAAKSSTTPA